MLEDGKEGMEEMVGGMWEVEEEETLNRAPNLKPWHVPESKRKSGRRN